MAVFWLILVILLYLNKNYKYLWNKTKTSAKIKFAKSAIKGSYGTANTLILYPIY